MPTDPRTGARVKIERAKEHIADLVSAIALFEETCPHEIVVEDDPDRWQRTWRVRVYEEPPARLGAIAGDAVHNLRSALDLIWRGLMFPGGGGRTNRKIAFGIYDSAEQFKAAQPAFIKPSRKMMMDIVNEAKPYKGGNDALWLLKELDEIDKHRLLLTAYSSISRGSITLPWVGALPVLRYTLPVVPGREGPLCPVKYNTVLFRHTYGPGGRRPDMDVDAEYPIEIALAEPEIIKGKAIIPTLHQLTEVVDNIVAQLARLL
jgi:hypothetical protein